MSYQYRTCTLE